VRMSHLPGTSDRVPASHPHAQMVVRVITSPPCRRPIMWMMLPAVGGVQRQPSRQEALTVRWGPTPVPMT